MKFAFGECDEIGVDVTLTCVHRDNEHNFIIFFLDLITKTNEIDYECGADQPPSYSLTSGHRVGIGHFLIEDEFIASKKYITLKKRSSQSLQEYQKQLAV